MFGNSNDPMDMLFGNGQQRNPYGGTGNMFGGNSSNPMDMLFGGGQQRNPYSNTGNMFGSNYGFGSTGRSSSGLGSLVGSMVGGSILSSLMDLLSDEFKVTNDEEEEETVTPESIPEEEVEASELTREEMAALPHTCPHCGAPVSRKSAICEYCDCSLI